MFVLRLLILSRLCSCQPGMPFGARAPLAASQPPVTFSRNQDPRGTEVDPDNFNKIGLESKSPQEALDTMKKLVEQQDALPWHRVALYADMMPDEQLKASMKERQQKRWAWYAMEWPAAPKDRGVVRFRPNANLTMKMWFSSEPDKRFYSMGHTNVLKAAFLQPENVALLQKHYDSASRTLALYTEMLTATLRVLREAIGPENHRITAASIGWLAHTWDLNTKNVTKSSVENDLTLAANTQRYAKVTPRSQRKPDSEAPGEDSLGAVRRIKPLEWVKRQVIDRQTITPVAYVAQLTANWCRMMRYVEIPTQSGKLPVPPPGYMETMNMQFRLNTLNLLDETVRDLLKLPMDTTVSGRQSLQTNLSFLIQSVGQLSSMYERLMAKYGDLYRGRAQGRTRISSQEESSAKRLKTILKSMVPKILSVATTPIGELAHLELTHSTQAIRQFHWQVPKLVGKTAVVKTDAGDWEAVGQLGRVNFDMVKSKYAAYQPLIVRAMENQLAATFINAANVQTQLAGHSPEGVTVSAHFRSKLICYYDHRKGDTRMLEILQMALPSIDTTVAKPAKQSAESYFMPQRQKTTTTPAPAINLLRAQLNPLSDESLWVTVGVVFDSWDYPNRTAAPKQLLDAYLRDEAEQAGVMTTVEYRPKPGEVFCKGEELAVRASKFLSQKGLGKGRDVPQVPPVLHAIQRRAERQIDAYAICLNLHEPETEVFLAGEERPAERLRKSALSEWIDTRAKAVTVAGVVDKKTFVPVYNLQQGDEASFDPKRARALVREYRPKPAADASGRIATRAARDYLESEFKEPTTTEAVLPPLPAQPSHSEPLSSAHLPIIERKPRTPSSNVVYYHARCNSNGTWTAPVRISEDQYRRKHVTP